MNLGKYLNPANYLRYWRKLRLFRQFKSLGGNVQLDPANSFFSARYISLGNNVFIGEGAHFAGDITVGNNVMFGPRPMVMAGNHLFAVEGESVRFLHPLGRENSRPILVEDEVWCGCSVVILNGVTVGMGSVIGAGSVLSRDIPPYVVATGNYCRPVKLIFDDATLLRHLVKLGYPAPFSEALVSRRSEELSRHWPELKLKTMDRTAAYRSLRESPGPGASH